MSRWRLSGYAEPGLFPGASKCRFRMTHIRDDGLVVMTVGDQREGGGRLAPVHAGHFFATFVGRVPPEGEIEVAPHSSYQEAAERHLLTLDIWEEIDA